MHELLDISDMKYRKWNTMWMNVFKYHIWTKFLSVISEQRWNETIEWQAKLSLGFYIKTEQCVQKKYISDIPLTIIYYFVSKLYI